MMSFSKGLFWLALALPFWCISCASVPVNPREVIANGVGTSLEEARSDAIRQGIQYQVGSYVTSDLEANNETVTKDVVTDYAGAIIERFEILNQNLRNDGLYEMKARMQITGDANRQRNRAVIARPGLIDGQSLQAEAASRFKIQTDSEQLWENALIGFPGRAFQYKVVSAGIATNPGNNDQVKLAFYTAGFWREDFLAEFQTLLKTTGRALKATKNIPYEAFWNNGSRDDVQTGICLKQGFRKPESDFACYIIDIPSHQFKKWLCGKYHPKLVFALPGFNSAAFQFENRSRRNILPYLEYDYNGMTSIFIFYIVGNEMIEDRTDYQEHISTLWSVNVPVNALPEIKNISARAECSKTLN